MRKQLTAIMLALGLPLAALGANTLDALTVDGDIAGTTNITADGSLIAPTGRVGALVVQTNLIVGGSATADDLTTAAGTIGSLTVQTNATIPSLTTSNATLQGQTTLDNGELFDNQSDGIVELQFDDNLHYPPQSDHILYRSRRDCNYRSSGYRKYIMGCN